MSFFFPEDNLQRMTPQETHIRSLTAEPYPDGERVRVNIEMTPFQTRPYIEILLTDADGEEVATASIVEPMGWKLEFTMHLRGAKEESIQDRSQTILSRWSASRAGFAYLRSLINELNINVTF